MTHNQTKSSHAKNLGGGIRLQNTFYFAKLHKVNHHFKKWGTCPPVHHVIDAHAYVW